MYLKSWASLIRNPRLLQRSPVSYLGKRFPQDRDRGFKYCPRLIGLYHIGKRDDEWFYEKRRQKEAQSVYSRFRYNSFSHWNFSLDLLLFT